MKLLKQDETEQVKKNDELPLKAEEATSKSAEEETNPPAPQVDVNAEETKNTEASCSGGYRRCIKKEKEEEEEEEEESC